MLLPWNENTSTWDTFISGVDQDGNESMSTFDSAIGVVDGSGTTGNGAISVTVTPDVAVWQTNGANYGWVMPGWIGRTDGTTISPGEASDIEARPRLRVLWVPAGSAVASFRQNVDGYTGAVDTDVRSDTPDTAYPTAASAFIDWAITGTAENEDVLIRFDNIMGTGANQIPSGSQIHGAVLELASTGNNAMGHGGHVHAMLQPWQDTSTWNSLVNGVSADNVEAVAANSATIGSPALTPIAVGGYHTFELTPDVDAWFKGTRPNYGWVLLPWVNGGDGWSIVTSDSGVERDRPRLRVFFTPSLTIGSIVRGPSSVTINVIGPAGLTGNVQRSTQVSSGYSTIGPITIQPDGTASFVDNSPPAGQAFYRIKSP
jgi:hypothetical protein